MAGVNFHPELIVKHNPSLAARGLVDYDIDWTRPQLSKLVDLQNRIINNFARLTGNSFLNVVPLKLTPPWTNVFVVADKNGVYSFLRTEPRVMLYYAPGQTALALVDLLAIDCSRPSRIFLLDHNPLPFLIDSAIKFLSLHYRSGFDFSADERELRKIVEALTDRNGLELIKRKIAYSLLPAGCNDGSELSFDVKQERIRLDSSINDPEIRKDPYSMLPHLAAFAAYSVLAKYTGNFSAQSWIKSIFAFPESSIGTNAPPCRDCKSYQAMLGVLATIFEYYFTRIEIEPTVH